MSEFALKIPAPRFGLGKSAMAGHSLVPAKQPPVTQIQDSRAPAIVFQINEIAYFKIAKLFRLGQRSRLKLLKGGL
jgi:hypothetical protein